MFSVYDSAVGDSGTSTEILSFVLYDKAKNTEDVMKKRRKVNADMETAEEAVQGGAVLPDIKEKVSSAVDTAVSFLSKYRLILIRTVLPTLYCLLFGGKLFDLGIYPFGVSAVCAVQSGIPACISAAAVAVSALFVRGGFFVALSAAAGAGVLVLAAKFRPSADTPVFRGTLSLAAGAGHALLLSLSGGVSFYEISGIVLAAVICPVLTVAIGGLLRSDGRTGNAAEMGICVLLYTVVYSLRGLSYTGESAATAVSMLSVLYASYAFGTHRGVVVGVAVGLAQDPRYAIVYAAAAAASGVLMNISVIGATAAGVLVALAMGIRSAGASAFGELFPEFIFCAAVAGPLFYYGIIPGREAVNSRRGETADDINGIRLERARDKFRALSEGLGVISAAMRRMSKVFSRPSPYEMRQICDSAFDENCSVCEGRSDCWDREYRATAAAVNSVAGQARSGKRVSISSLPEGMRQRCPYLGGIVSRINIGAATAMRTAKQSDRTAAAAESYGAISRLMEEAENSVRRELEPDTAGTEKLCERFAEMGMYGAEVNVYGERRRLVQVRGLERGCTVTGEELRDAASSVFGCDMSMPEYRISGTAVSFEMHTAEKFSLDFGRYSVAKRGERCGDSITSFKGDGGYGYTLISDGMGSGSEAALTSGACALFLERMLGAGCSLTSSMEMLNSFLAGRNTECFATVDLMEADLVTGELRFVKSGAAPSFVLREGKLFKLSSSTVPVGIVMPYDAEQIKFSAKAGDHVIMMSDGVVPDGDDPAWLYGLLCDRGFITDKCDTSKAAERIAKAAAEHTCFGDDITVGVVRISRAS